ncbi:hypothetical protein [Parasphingorhabdus pacifica]
MLQTERRRGWNQRRLRDLVTQHGDEVTVFSAHNGAEFRHLSTTTGERDR